MLNLPGIDARVTALENTPSVPMGCIMAFSGTFGGEGNRFPIPLGTTEPDKHWVLCDGQETNSFPVPDLRGRMILGSSAKYPVNSTGGSDAINLSLAGAIGAVTLSIDQMPSHNHKEVFNVDGWGEGRDGNKRLHPANIVSPYGTTHTGGSQSHTHSLNAEGGSGSNMPPYFSLSFIMRIA